MISESMRRFPCQRLQYSALLWPDFHSSFGHWRRAVSSPWSRLQQGWTAESGASPHALALHDCRRQPEHRNEGVAGRSWAGFPRETKKAPSRSLIATRGSRSPC